MELTEKKLFELDDYPSGYIEDSILDLFGSGKESNYSQSLISLSYIKKMILEVLKNREVEINSNVSYDVDKLLKDIVDVKKDLIGFDIEYYKDPQKLNSYIDKLIENMNWESIESIQREFFHTNDSFRKYFILYLPDLVRLSDKLYWEIKRNTYEEQKPQITVDDDEEWDDIDWDTDSDEEVPDFEVSNKDLNKQTEDMMSTEKLIDYLKFINVVMTLVKFKDLGHSIDSKLFDLVQKKKLNEFYSDEEFSKMFDLIMFHDKTKETYYFHGTQYLEAAQTIMEQGLGMMHDTLSDTSYSELSKDEVILKSRGIGNEVGRDAFVILSALKDQNGKEINIVEKIKPGQKIDFMPSGLQGVNGKAEYVVNTENIVGYVNKTDKKIVFNPRFRDYERYNIKTL